MGQFRPIDLCNTVVKVISKALARRLKNFLPYVICETQSAFIPNHFITDNILLAYEAHHVIKNKKTGRDGFMSIKLDMFKAYDRVEWSFMKAMLIHLGFGANWVSLIVSYVEFVTYSLLINGEQVGGELSGLTMGNVLQPLSHIMFAYDTLLLGKASIEEAQTIKRIMCLYEQWSRQSVNVQKSTNIFSPNVELWSIPTYTMQFLKLPTQVYKEIDTLLSNYWWGSDTKNKKIHWISWTTLCKSKEEGGLGFRKAQDFNNALLCKQAWRLLTDPNSTLALTYKARYFPNGSFLTAELGTKPSYTWCSLLSIRDLINKGTKWELGNGKNINIWKQRWVNHTQSNMLITPCDADFKDFMVSNLIDEDIGVWKVDLVRSLFFPIVSEAILQISLSHLDRVDIP
ncbi:hypothetical protein LIER_17693 [Lithospermum erythrorhizon]|uniref:Reverse transcriptase domain-containing protein n=1 Tax=Lithospermum erythrorhizon TaxID=34254 RepID=A0AAV3QEI5_LITER